MNSRVRWVGAVGVGFGAAIAIVAHWPKHTDSVSPPAIAGAQRPAAKHAESARAGSSSGRNVAAWQDVPESAFPSTIPSAGTTMVQRFESESKDPTWSDAANAQFLSKLSRMNYLKALYLDVDCRTTMCRIVIAPARVPPPQWELQEIVYKLGLSGWQFHDNGRTMLTYLERDRLIWVEPPNAAVQ
jgi:hypothetical protein